MKLSLLTPRYYRVKRGQTLSDVARAFGCTPALLAARNGSGGGAAEGSVLFIPPHGDLYEVTGGESETLLCGSPARFLEKNGTRYLYPGQTVLL